MPRPKFHTAEARKKNAWGTPHYGSARCKRRPAVSTKAHESARSLLAGALSMFVSAAQGAECKATPGRTPPPWSSSIPPRAAAAARRRTAGCPAWRRRPGARPGGAARAARRLLGLHRLEGPLRQARVFAAAAQALPAAAAWRWSTRRRCCCRGGISAAGERPPSTPRWRRSPPSRPGRSISLAVRQAAGRGLEVEATAELLDAGAAGRRRALPRRL